MADTLIDIRRSKIHGCGVFAARNFEKGQKIYSFQRGRILRAVEIKNLAKKERRYLDYVGADKFEIIEPPGRFVNHSCVPNVEERKRAGYALRRIKKNEELTIDYDHAAYLDEPFRCRCMARSCKKIIRGK